MASIPCRASYFVPGWFEERDDFHQANLKNRMGFFILQIVLVQNSYRGKELEKSVSQGSYKLSGWFTLTEINKVKKYMGNIPTLDLQ